MADPEETIGEVENWTDYSIEAVAALRDRAQSPFVKRAAATAITKLEEAQMWFNKALELEAVHG